MAELRTRVEVPARKRSIVRCVTGEARAMHADPELEGALFQVAAQFNLLEMAGPSVTPEDGVTRYSGDPTQGPACAIAAGAATIYRNYFVETAPWPHDEILHAWWVEPGRLLVGEYPGATTSERAREKVGLLIDAGVDSIVDLTTPTTTPTRI